jgi:hypothetical protein
MDSEKKNGRIRPGKTRKSANPSDFRTHPEQCADMLWKKQGKQKITGFQKTEKCQKFFQKSVFPS